MASDDLTERFLASTHARKGPAFMPFRNVTPELFALLCAFFDLDQIWTSICEIETRDAIA